MCAVCCLSGTLGRCSRARCWGTGLELVRLRPDLLFVPAILLLPFLSDVLLTLAWRTRLGKKLFAAHLDHTYQIALKAGLKHSQVSGVHAVWAMNAAVVAVGATIVGGYAPVIAFVALLAISSWVHWRVRRAGVANGLVGGCALAGNEVRYPVRGQYASLRSRSAVFRIGAGSRRGAWSSCAGVLS